MKLIIATCLFLLTPVAFAKILPSGASVITKGAIQMKCESPETTLLASLELDSNALILYRIGHPKAEYFLRDFGFKFPILLKENGVAAFPEHHGAIVDTNFRNDDNPSLTLKISRPNEEVPAFQETMNCQ